MRPGFWVTCGSRLRTALESGAAALAVTELAERSFTGIVSGAGFPWPGGAKAGSIAQTLAANG